MSSGYEIPAQRSVAKVVSSILRRGAIMVGIVALCSVN